jgi:glycyl-tRNA synthetase
MACEYFVHPDEAIAAYAHWKAARYEWYSGLGIPTEYLRLREHASQEPAHFMRETTEIEFLYPWGWGELEAVACRGNFDLMQHGHACGKDLSYIDDRTGERFLPHVIEPAAGVDRALLAFLFAAFDEEPDKDGIRTVLRLHKALAPVKVAVLPLSKKEQLCTVARNIAARLRPHFATSYDETASIGKRYRRQDEIGTPYCVTVDFDTLTDEAVTVRDRDTMVQDRVPTGDLVHYLVGLLA